MGLFIPWTIQEGKIASIPQGLLISRRAVFTKNATIYN